MPIRWISSRWPRPWTTWISSRLSIRCKLYANAPGHRRGGVNAGVGGCVSAGGAEAAGRTSASASAAQAERAGARAEPGQRDSGKAESGGAVGALRADAAGGARKGFIQAAGGAPGARGETTGQSGQAPSGAAGAADRAPEGVAESSAGASPGGAAGNRGSEGSFAASARGAAERRRAENVLAAGAAVDPRHIPQGGPGSARKSVGFAGRPVLRKHTAGAFPAERCIPPHRARLTRERRSQQRPRQLLELRRRHQMEPYLKRGEFAEGRGHLRRWNLGRGQIQAAPGDAEGQHPPPPGDVLGQRARDLQANLAGARRAQRKPLLQAQRLVKRGFVESSQPDQMLAQPDAGGLGGQRGLQRGGREMTGTGQNLAELSFVLQQGVARPGEAGRGPQHGGGVQQIAVDGAKGGKGGEPRAVDSRAGGQPDRGPQRGGRQRELGQGQGQRGRAGPDAGGRSVEKD